jgi:YidC/Oxa1 family membrane protein insertase
MSLIFTFMLAGFSTGLVIYWTWNNTLSVCQQAFIMNRYGAKIELWDNLRDLWGGSRARGRRSQRLKVSQ